MAAGITDRLWSLEDIVAKIDPLAPAAKTRALQEAGERMSSLWWMIPFGAFMLWGVAQFFRGGGPPSDGGSDSGAGEL